MYREGERKVRPCVKKRKRKGQLCKENVQTCPLVLLLSLHPSFFLPSYFVSQLNCITISNNLILQHKHNLPHTCTRIRTPGAWNEAKLVEEIESFLGFLRLIHKIKYHNNTQVVTLLGLSHYWAEHNVKVQ